MRGASVSFFVALEKKKKFCSNPDCHLCNWITQSRKKSKRDFVTRKKSKDIGASHTSTTHARTHVCVLQCSTRIGAGAYAHASNQLEKANLGPIHRSWHGESVVPRATSVCLGIAAGARRTNRFRWRTNKRINYSNIIISSPAPIVSAEFSVF